MKIKILVSGLIYLFFSFCAASTQITLQESLFYENHTFDDVWSATLKTIMDMGYTIKSSDREGGFIYAQGHKDTNFLAREEPPNLNIIISDKNGKISIDCQVIMPGTPVDLLNKREKVMKKFLDTLDKNLIKQAGLILSHGGQHSASLPLIEHESVTENEFLISITLSFNSKGY